MILPARQKGVVLFMLLLVIALAIGGYIFSQMSLSEIEVERDKVTLQALKKAKQALLAYVMNYDKAVANPDQGPGNFPCPDSSADEDGNPNPVTGLDPACGNAPANGVLDRFPWEELGTGELRDGSGELLWYAVSRNYVAATPARQTNTSTPGQILIRNSDGSISADGSNPLEAIVAVIIAPGEPIVREDGIAQVRGTAAQQADSRNYLDIAYDGTAEEEDNASYVNSSASNGFILGPIVDAANNVIVNDQFITITYEEVMDLVHARVASDVTDALNAYKASPCLDFPDASEFDEATYDPSTNNYDSNAAFKIGHLPDNVWDTGCAAGIELPTWFDDEGWYENTFYQFVNIPCAPNCIVIKNDTVEVRNDVEAIIMFAGRADGQDRSTVPVTRSMYYEGENINLDSSDVTYDINESEDSIWVVAP